MSPANKRTIISCQFTWQDIEIEVLYEPDWLGPSQRGFATAHLSITAIRPARAALPFTETGYRSRFLQADEVEAEGGPENYVRRWLDWAACDPAWKEYEAATRQLSLF